MPISHVDYEPAAEPPKPAKVKARFPVFAARAKEPTDVKSNRPAVAESTVTRKKPEQPATKQISVSREKADAPSPPQTPPQKDSPDAEKTAAPTEPPAEDGPTEQPPSAPGPVNPPEEQAGNAGRPGPLGAGRDFQNRFDAAQSRISNQSQNAEELPQLLDQAVTLLEAVANHPAITNYSALKQRLDNVEQIVHSSANVR